MAGVTTAFIASGLLLVVDFQPAKRNPEVLEALAIRCEKEPASRELDLRIWLALFDKPIMVDGGGYGPRRHEPKYKRARLIWTPSWFNRMAKGLPCVATAQIDSAAMTCNAPLWTFDLGVATTTLAPCKQWSIASFCSNKNKQRLCNATCAVKDGAEREAGNAMTPALAFCAAACRAWAAS